MTDEAPEIVAGSERDFGYVYRDDGIFRVTVGYTEAGEKVKIDEVEITGDDARTLALQAVYGDAWEPDQAEAFDELAGEHGPAGAALRLRYLDYAERQETYEARLLEVEEFETAEAAKAVEGE